MSTAVTKLHNSAMWKLRTLLRARRFYEVEETITTYKTKILSYLEYRTPANYHADGVQTKLLREMGLSDEDALSKFHLAPLTSRRDMAMLGLIHRTVLGMGPP